MKKKLIIVFLVFTAIGVGLFYLLTMGNVGVKYDTALVTKGEYGKYVEDTGTIGSKNIRRYYGNGIGEVEEMSLALGDHVKKGQLLVRYEDSNDLIDLQIQQVDKQIEALEAAYNEAQSSTNMGSVNNARIEISRIKSQIETATANKDKIEALYNEGIVSLTEFEQSEEQIRLLNSSLDMARNTYNQLVKGISDNIRLKYEAEIDALILSKDILEKNKEEKSVYADVDGIVTELNTFVGDKPSMGIMIIELQDPTAKVVLVDFMVEDAIRVLPDQTAEIRDYNLDIHMEALKVDKIYPKAFVTLSELGVRENRQIVEIGLGREADSLPFGLEVETRVMVDAPRETLLVPSGAVIQKNGKQYVKVMIEGEPLEKEVVTGIKIEGKIEVLDGLEEGQEVVLNYQED